MGQKFDIHLTLHVGPRLQLIEAKKGHSILPFCHTAILPFCHSSRRSTCIVVDTDEISMD